MVERTAYYDDGYGYEDEDDRRGLIGRVLGAALRHPIRTVLTVVLVGAGLAIVANAAFLQSGEHPSPFFATRDGAPAEATVDAAAAAADPVEASAAPAAEQVDEIGRLVAVTTADAPQVDATAASTTVVEVQQMLLAQGYDPGVVDGLFGGNTAAAIEAYQADHDMRVTGEVSAQLVAALRETMPDPVSEAVVLPTEEAQILAVQTALNQIGYGPVVADGELTNETAAAIRAFQLEYGLNVTGLVDQALIDRLTAIGALVSR